VLHRREKFVVWFNMDLDDLSVSNAESDLEAAFLWNTQKFLLTKKAKWTARYIQQPASDERRRVVWEPALLRTRRKFHKFIRRIVATVDMFSSFGWSISGSIECAVIRYNSDGHLVLDRP